MSMRIRQLPAAIANQIAAGEVIERPASVIKELLENSLDAGATLVHIDVGYGGLNQIKISDNGIGIVAEDLPLAIAAHATSKITSLNDLYAINSMGFRGEALASIASIARVSISSKTRQQEHAMMLTMRGNEPVITACARTEGTTVEVLDLFFNAPVRKRFLKNERLEFQAIEGVVKRFALSAPHIAIHLNHNNKAVLALPAALNEQAQQIRMTKIFGSAFIKNAVFLDVTQGSMHLHGWISDVHYQRSQNDRQWVYINQRMVKDKLIHHAIKQAYDDLLYPGRFPSCLLYFTINTDEVDVNVHPTKHEVRFQQSRLVHDFFSTHLRKALQTRTDSSASDVCEPTPHFAVPMVHSTAMDHIPLKPRSVPLVTNDELVAWTVLNKHYCLFWIQQHPYLVDIAQLYQNWLQQHIQEHLPLASRPLLVSVRFNFLTEEFDELQRVLLSVGIVIEAHDVDLVVRSVPIILPYLDLKLFFSRLGTLKHYSLALVIDELLNSQMIDAQQLSIEERAALNQYLLHLQTNSTPSKAFKRLTLDDCRMLLHV